MENEDLKVVLAFLFVMADGNLMDRTPAQIIEEINKVEQDRGTYIASLTESQRKLYEAYLSFHNI